MSTPLSTEQQVCEGCGREIDPDYCGCGDPINDHSMYSGHSPIPMGCECGRDKMPMPERNELLTDPLLGEGFAFFRWHCINWSFTSCRGFNDPRSACDTQWMALIRQSAKRNAPHG
jgi:hypothetical protein